MAINDSLIYAIPPEIVGKLEGLIFVLKTLGWAIVVYVIFSIINMMINRKKNKEFQLMNKNLEDIKYLLMGKHQISSISEKN